MTETRRRKAESFRQWLKANESAVLPGALTDRKLAEENEWAHATAPLPPSTDHDAVDGLTRQRESNRAGGTIYRHITCTRCGRTGHFAGSQETFDELVPNRDEFECDRCQAGLKPRPPRQKQLPRDQYPKVTL